MREYSKKVFTMKSLPRCDRPYEKVESSGNAGALTDSELLAVIIKSGTRSETAVDVSRRLLELCGDSGLRGLHDVSYDELLKVRGIGKVKAVQLKALCELAKRMSYLHGSSKVRIRSFEQLGNMLLADMAMLKKEVFRIVLLDKKWHIVKISEVSVGTVDQALVHPREVFSEAIRSLCSAVVLVHNHPSGDVLPSEIDVKTTERLVISGEIIGIEVVDHIITGNNSFYSMYLSGDMKHIKRSIVR